MFEMEAEKLWIVLWDACIAIHHIGSTAISTIYAKPIIDLLVQVNKIEKVDSLSPPMEQIGYEAKGEFDITGRRFFIKGGDKRTHHIHVFEKGHKEIAKHWAFRDYLIAHLKEARQYSQLKQTLAKKHLFDIQKYIEGKNDYIQKIDKKAKNWLNLQ